MTSGLGVAAPLLAQFVPPPPLIVWPPLLSYGTCAITALITYFWFERRARRRVRLQTWGVWLASAMVSVVACTVLLRFTTVLEPQRDEIRFQIGFGLADWTLTEHGRQLVRAHPNLTERQLILADGGFIPGGPERIWTGWSVYTAGSLLIVLYLGALIAWTVTIAIGARALLDAGVWHPRPPSGAAPGRKGQRRSAVDPQIPPVDPVTMKGAQ